MPRPLVCAGAEKYLSVSRGVMRHSTVVRLHQWIAKGVQLLSISAQTLHFSDVGSACATARGCMESSHLVCVVFAAKRPRLTRLRPFSSPYAYELCSASTPNKEEFHNSTPNRETQGGVCKQRSLACCLHPKSLFFLLLWCHSQHAVAISGLFA